MTDKIESFADSVLKAAALTGVAGLLLPMSIKYRDCFEDGSWVSFGLVGMIVSLSIGGLAIFILGRATSRAFPRRSGVVNNFIKFAEMLAISSCVVVLSEVGVASQVGTSCSSAASAHIESS